jgi:hypothetical protein
VFLYLAAAFKLTGTCIKNLLVHLYYRHCKWADIEDLILLVVLDKESLSVLNTSITTFRISTWFL